MSLHDYFDHVTGERSKREAARVAAARRDIPASAIPKRDDPMAQTIRKAILLQRDGYLLEEVARERA